MTVTVCDRGCDEPVTAAVRRLIVTVAAGRDRGRGRDRSRDRDRDRDRDRPGRQIDDLIVKTLLSVEVKCMLIITITMQCDVIT